MSATLVAKDLAAGHGDRALFAGLDLVVAPHDVIGLVGANGAGKSTLLRLLAGVDVPESGTVSLNPSNAVIGRRRVVRGSWPSCRVVVGPWSGSSAWRSPGG